MKTAIPHLAICYYVLIFKPYIWFCSGSSFAFGDVREHLSVDCYLILLFFWVVLNALIFHLGPVHLEVANQNGKCSSSCAYAGAKGCGGAQLLLGPGCRI